MRETLRFPERPVASAVLGIAFALLMLGLLSWPLLTSHNTGQNLDSVVVHPSTLGGSSPSILASTSYSSMTAVVSTSTQFSGVINPPSSGASSSSFSFSYISAYRTAVSTAPSSSVAYPYSAHPTASQVSTPGNTNTTYLNGQGSASSSPSSYSLSSSSPSIGGIIRTNTTTTAVSIPSYSISSTAASTKIVVEPTTTTVIQNSSAVPEQNTPTAGSSNSMPRSTTGFLSTLSALSISAFVIATFSMMLMYRRVNSQDAQED